MNKVEVIEALVKNLKDELAYEKWYNEELERLRAEHKDGDYTLYYFLEKNRTPSKATIRESFKMIGRMGFQSAGEIK